MNSLAADGMQVNHYYATYAPRPADLPSADFVREKSYGCRDRTDEDAVGAAGAGLHWTGVVRISSSGGIDCTSPEPFAQRGAPPVGVPTGCRSADEQSGRSQRLERQDRRSSTSRIGFSTDDPLLKDYKGTPVIGSYTIDEEGVPAQKVTIVEDGEIEVLADVASAGT